MKTKPTYVRFIGTMKLAIVATLLVAAAASADARFAWLYPRKAVPPDENGHWIIITDDLRSRDVESDSPRLSIDKLAVMRRVRATADRKDLRNSSDAH